MSDPLVGRIVRILDADRLIANVGLEHGAAPGDRFVVFESGEEIVDPETGDSLGCLELVKGEVIALHVQPRMVQLGPPPQDADGDSTVLSATLAQTTRRRGGPAVRRDQIAGMPSVGPIAVGDHVRRI